MKLAVMQPYFFPYLGYYSLIHYADKLILFDTVQYIKHGWIDRNRILKPVAGWQYIAVPLKKKSLSLKINELEIKEIENWKGKLVRQLAHYKKRAPYFRETLEVVEESLDIRTSSVVKLNENILKRTCQYLGMEFNVSIFSEMQLKINEVAHPGGWALQIAKSLMASEYVNPVGGKELFRPEEFEQVGINLRFLGNNLDLYSQKRNTFEVGLSIIDVMMFNDVERINKMIDSQYTVIY